MSFESFGGGLVQGLEMNEWGQKVGCVFGSDGYIWGIGFVGLGGMLG